MRQSILALILFLACLWIGVNRSWAQSPWIDADRVPSLSLEWDNPSLSSYRNPDPIQPANSVLFVTGRIKAGKKTRLVVEVPFSHTVSRNTVLNQGPGHTSIGNIYVGGERDLSVPDAPSFAWVSAGIRIPTLHYPDNRDKNGYLTGLLSQISRKEAFIQETWSIPVIFQLIYPVRKPFALKLRAGTLINVFTGNYGKVLENQHHLLYGLTVLIQYPGFQAYVGIDGRNQLAGNDADFFDSGLTQVRGGIDFVVGRWKMGIFVRTPLGSNYKNYIEAAYGLKIEYGIR